MQAGHASIVCSGSFRVQAQQKLAITLAKAGVKTQLYAQHA